MRFGPTPLDEAVAAILAHKVRLPGRALAKGHVLTAEDVEALRAAGHAEVVTARLEPDDVPEDEAVRELAAALVGGAPDDKGDGNGVSGLAAARAFTGRCNLFATTRGVLRLDMEGIQALNAVGEELTLATLPSSTVVEPRRLVATVKLIPFALPRSCLDRCLELVRERGPLLEVAAFVPRRAALVSTVLPGLKESVLDKTAVVIGDKLARIDARLEAERRCPHTEEAVAAALGEVVAEGAELIVVIGASAIVDRRDVVPVAIERVGGAVERLGIPVDPGNLCLYARIGEVPVVGLPGSSRSPAASGEDLLLRRIGAGLPLSDSEFASWGVGGLLKEQGGRPVPRAGGVPPEQAEDAITPEEGAAVAQARPARTPMLAAVILAAGRSRRMGEINKLLEPVAGEPMVRHAVRAALAIAAGGPPAVVVVTGHERERVEAALAGLEVAFVHNPDYAAGLSTSLARGIGALPRDAEGAFVCLGDMPGVLPAHLERLRDAFDPAAGAAICVATHRGKRGNPVLFASRFFAELCEIEGDVGARHLLGAHGESVREVEMPDDAVLLDIDSPAALRDYRAKAERDGG